MLPAMISASPRLTQLGRVAGTTDPPHEPGAGLRQRLQGGAVGVGALGAVAGDRPIEEPGMELLQRFVAEAALLDFGGQPIDHEDIGRGQEIAQDGRACVPVDLQRQ